MVCWRSKDQESNDLTQLSGRLDPSLNFTLMELHTWTRKMSLRNSNALTSLDLQV